MDLDAILKKLTTKFAFPEVNYKIDDQTPNLEVCLHLTPAQINKVIAKANRLNDLITSCANMVRISDSSIPMDLLMQTTIRCSGNNQLYIRTVEPMIKLLIEIIFD